MALYSCVNEIMTHVTAVPERGSASKPNVGCGLTRQGAARIGAMECVARLARGGHGPAMSGGAGSLVAAVAKLLKSTDGSSAGAGRAFPNAWALTPDGARALRRCALRSLAAVVGGASRERPLRAEVRTAAARVVNDAIAHGLAHPRSPSSLSSASSKGSSKDLIARELEEKAVSTGHSCAREAFSLADLAGDRERMIPGAGRTVRAAACVAAGALASTPGGSGLWGDEGGGRAGRGSAKGSARSAAEEMRDSLLGALEEGDEETRGCAASALGALGAARLYPSEHTHATRVAPDGSNGTAPDTAVGALDDTPTKIGGSGNNKNNKKPTHHGRSSSSGGGLFGGLMRGRVGGDAESSAAAAAARAAAATAAAAAPLDLDGAGVDRRWTETIETCFVRAFRDACRAPGPDGRRARHGLAAAMVRFTACVSEKSLENGKSVPARLLVGMTSQVYGAIADALEGPGGMAREDAPHAEACALHVLRCGVIARLDEPGRGSLLRSLASTIFFGDDESESDKGTSKVNFVRNVNVPGDIAMRAIAHALTAAGRVDDDTADALCGCVFRAMDSGGCPDEVAVASARLASASPRRAAGLLRRSVEKISANAGAAGTMDAAAVAAACGGAAATAALAAAGDVLPLGLPGGLLRDAAAAAFALAGGVVDVDDADAECELRARGFLAAAGVLRGPSGRVEAESRRDEILSLLKKASDAKALRTLLESPENDAGQSKSSVFGFMSSSAAKKKRRPSTRWPPARELRWRAAAVDLLAAYAHIARTDESNGDDDDAPSVVEELLDDAARCSLVNTVHFFADPRGGGEGAEAGPTTAGTYADPGEWPADPSVAAQLASLRLATLRAFDVVHGENARKCSGGRGGDVGYSNALVALCGTAVRPLPGSNLGSACVVALRLALGRRGDDADAGPWASGGGGGGDDAALDELRAFDGGWDAPADEEVHSGFGFGYAKGSGRGFSRRFPRPAGLAATLQATRVRALAFLCTVDPAALRFVEAEAGIVVKGGDDSNPKGGDDSNPATVRRIELDDSSGSPASPASLVNACVACVALADSNRFKSFADVNAVATSLARVAGAIGRSRWSGPAHWRVAAETRARAAELGGDAAAESLLNSLAASLPSTPPRRGDDNRDGASKTPNPTTDPSDPAADGPSPRAIAACTASATFRKVGFLASTSATGPLVRSLLQTSAQVDVGCDATHLWPLHALGVVARHVGPGFARFEKTARRLAFAMMNSPAIECAARDAETRAACGRVVNAAVAAIGPDLDPGGETFASFAALVAAVRDGGENGGGTDDDGGADAGPHDAGCQLEAALFLQQLAVFAPQTAPPDVLVRRLRPYLASPRLRCEGSPPRRCGTCASATRARCFVHRSARAAASGAAAASEAASRLTCSRFSTGGTAGGTKGASVTTVTRTTIAARFATRRGRCGC